MKQNASKNSSETGRQIPVSLEFLLLLHCASTLHAYLHLDGLRAHNLTILVASHGVNGSDRAAVIESIDEDEPAQGSVTIVVGCHRASLRAVGKDAIEDDKRDRDTRLTCVDTYIHRCVVMYAIGNTDNLQG